MGQWQCVHLSPARLNVHANHHAGARSCQAEQEALGHRLPELRVRPVGCAVVQEIADRGTTGGRRGVH